MSHSRLQNLLNQRTTPPTSDLAGVSDNVSSGKIGNHTNSAQISNSGNSNVTLNTDATARTAAANEQATSTINGNTQDPNINTQMLLNLLQPLLEVSKELNKTAINNLLANNNTK